MGPYTSFKGMHLCPARCELKHFLLVPWADGVKFHVLWPFGLHGLVQAKLDRDGRFMVVDSLGFRV